MKTEEIRAMRSGPQADADVVPPAEWRDIVEAADPKPWRLRGALRHECSDPRNLDPLAWPPASGDGVGVGFFPAPEAI